MVNLAFIAGDKQTGDKHTRLSAPIKRTVGLSVPDTFLRLDAKPWGAR
jgi:hypothetical protein